MKLQFYISIVFSLALSSCFEAHESLEGIEPRSITVQPDYERNQFVYVSLDGQLNVKDNTNNKWHLRFQNGMDQWNIYLNPTERVTLYKSNTSNWNLIDHTIDLTSLDWQTDAPTSSGIYPAIGQWGDFSFSSPKSYQTVYILRVKKGITASYFKLQILDATTTSYTIRYGSLNGSFDKTITIEKNAAFQHSFVELDTQAREKLIEPPIQNWDLCVTYLSDSIQSNGLHPYFPTINPYYGVYSGLLINQQTNTFAVETEVPFEEVDFFYAKNLTYIRSDKLDASLVLWDALNEQAYANEGVTVIFKKGEDLHAVQAVNVIGDYPLIFSLEFRVKKL